MRNKRQGSNKVSHKAETQKCKEMFINHFETITINIIIAFFIICSLITEHFNLKVWKLEHQPSSLAYTFIIVISSPFSFCSLFVTVDSWVSFTGYHSWWSLYLPAQSVTIWSPGNENEKSTIFPQNHFLYLYCPFLHLCSRTGMDMWTGWNPSVNATTMTLWWFSCLSIIQFIIPASRWLSTQTIQISWIR